MGEAYFMFPSFISAYGQVYPNRALVEFARNNDKDAEKTTNIEYRQPM